MKVRYRNIVTLEQRDVERHSPEENLLLEQVTSVSGESRSLWMTEDDYQTEQVEQAAEREARQTSEAITFGSHRGRLTPGEVEMGISSYDQKARELGRDEVAELDAELDEAEEEEDDDEPEDGAPAPPAAATTATRPQTRSGQARRPARRTARKGSK